MATNDRAARAARIHAILDELHPVVGSPLAHETPFQLLVAVILSAQCTDARVNIVTPALFAAAPDAHAMAKLKPREVLKLIKTCGLANGKAKNLVAMSKALVAKHAGQVPQDFASLEALAGVGHKTTGVVMAQAFGVPAFPVDTHIHRLAGRWGLSRARNVVEVERDLKALFPEDRWNALHLQIIYFGRAQCPARAHDPDACPICSWAMSGAKRKAEERQRRAEAKARKKPTKRGRTTVSQVTRPPLTSCRARSRGTSMSGR